MAKITHWGLTFNIDALNNPVIKEIVVERVVAVPNATTPEVTRVTSVMGWNQKTTLWLFSKREEISLTWQWTYLWNVTFTKSDYEDEVTEFTAKAEYLIETLSANSSCSLRLYNFDWKAIITWSEVSSDTLWIEKKKLTSWILTMPTSAIIEVRGKKDWGSVDFLNTKIHIEKKRKA